MTSKIIVNNIGSDTGINTVTFDSNVQRGSSNLHSTGLNVNNTFVHSTGIALGAGSTIGAVTGVTTYFGDGSQLTGITGTTINNNADNRIITGSGTANTLNGEASLTFDAGLLKIDDLGGTAGKGRLEFGNSGEQFIEGFDTGNAGSGSYLRFGDGSTERLRIGSSGQIGLSGANYGSSGQVLTSQGSGSAAVWAAASGGKVVNYDHTIVTAAGSASLPQGHYSNNIIGKSYAAASGSNKLLLIAMVSVGYQHSQAIAARFTLSNNGIDASTGDASGSRRRATTAVHNQSQYQMESMTLVYVHSNPSTTALTYGVQLGQSDNGTQTVYWNRSQNDSNHNYRIRAATTLTIIEVEG